MSLLCKVNLCSIKCPLYTVGERLGENRIFGFPQKYHVKTTQDSTQMTFGCLPLCKGRHLIGHSFTLEWNVSQNLYLMFGLGKEGGSNLKLM